MKTTNKSYAYIFIAVIILIIGIGAFYSSGFSSDKIKFGKEYSSVLECVQQLEKKGGKVDYTISNIFFEYENDKQALVLYNSPDGEIWTCLIDKKNKNGEIKYVLNTWNNRGLFMMPVYEGEKSWYELGDFRYRIAYTEEDIEQYIEIEPKTTYIKYLLYTAENEKEGYFCLVDLSETN